MHSSFTLGLLWTDTAAYGREHILGLDNLCGVPEISKRYLGNKRWDVYADRAPVHAFRLLALQAPLCLKHGLIRGETRGNFMKIMYPDIRQGGLP